jgi:hypothetical protein
MDPRHYSVRVDNISEKNDLSESGHTWHELILDETIVFIDDLGASDRLECIYIIQEYETRAVCCTVF